MGGDLASYLQEKNRREAEIYQASTALGLLGAKQATEMRFLGDKLKAMSFRPPVNEATPQQVTRSKVRVRTTNIPFCGLRVTNKTTPGRNCWVWGASSHDESNDSESTHEGEDENEIVFEDGDGDEVPWLQVEDEHEVEKDNKPEHDAEDEHEVEKEYKVDRDATLFIGSKFTGSMKAALKTNATETSTEVVEQPSANSRSQATKTEESKGSDDSANSQRVAAMMEAHKPTPGAKAGREAASMHEYFSYGKSLMSNMFRSVSKQERIK